jgi:hypothetical protein
MRISDSFGGPLEHVLARLPVAALVGAAGVVRLRDEEETAQPAGDARVEPDRETAA